MGHPLIYCALEKRISPFHRYNFLLKFLVIMIIVKTRMRPVISGGGERINILSDGKRPDPHRYT
jgi:hypothetical protein